MQTKTTIFYSEKVLINDLSFGQKIEPSEFNALLIKSSHSNPLIQKLWINEITDFFNLLQKHSFCSSGML